MVVIAASYRRRTARYGERGVMYTHMEAGNVFQNVFLMAEAPGLWAGIVGAFDDEGLSRALRLPGDQVPLLVIPVGYKH
jgi:nitroreductase